jgi:hypothetical protein
MGMPDEKKWETLDSILPAELKDPSKYNWKTKYGQITRGDLMRLAGWAPRNTDGTPVEGLGKYPTHAPEGRRILSGVLENLQGEDFLNLGKILQDNLKMSYGTSVYFCCSCT